MDNLLYKDKDIMDTDTKYPPPYPLGFIILELLVAQLCKQGDQLNSTHFLRVLFQYLVFMRSVIPVKYQWTTNVELTSDRR